MKIKNFFIKNYLMILILSFTFLAHLFFFFNFHEIWWDSGVYIGMGKFLLSLGKVGLWEHIRPVFWPVILGTSWKLFPNNFILIPKILELILVVSSVFLIYLIGKKVYSKTAGIIAAAFLASSTILFYLSFHLYTEIPVLFFVLLAYYFLINDKSFFAGLFLAIAFLTKFPSALFLAIVFFFLLFRKSYKQILYLVLGSFVVLIPFFISNIVFYHNIFGGLLDAQQVIRNVLGCNVLRSQPWYYYFFLIFFYENKFLAVSLVGFFRKSKYSLLITMSLIIPLLYFIFLPCRDYRYLVMFLPFVILLAGAGLELLINSFRKKQFKVLILISLVLAVSFVGYRMAFVFYENNEAISYSAEKESFFNYLDNRSVSGEVWTSNPVLSAYSDNKLNKIYYPVYDGNISTTFFNYLHNNSDKIEFVFLDNCGGGIICHPDDYVCSSNNGEMISYLNKEFNLVLKTSKNNCWYKVYHNLAY